MKDEDIQKLRTIEKSGSGSGSGRTRKKIPGPGPGTGLKFQSGSGKKNESGETLVSNLRYCEKIRRPAIVLICYQAKNLLNVSFARKHLNTLPI